MTITEKIELKRKKIDDIKQQIKVKEDEIKKIEEEISELNNIEVKNVLNEYKITSASELKKLLKSLKSA